MACEIMADHRRVYLVSCVAQKRPFAAEAQDLYTSPWFRKARQYVVRSGCPWFILSAEHGLVSPEQVLEPYDKTLNTMKVAERRAWARRVQVQMAIELPDAIEVVILAGAKYRGYLESWLRSRYSTVSVPMRGLRIGEQLRWLSENEPSFCGTITTSTRAMTLTFCGS